MLAGAGPFEDSSSKLAGDAAGAIVGALLPPCKTDNFSKMSY